MIFDEWLGAAIISAYLHYTQYCTVPACMLQLYKNSVINRCLFE